MMLQRTTFLTLMLTLWLAGCGGGGGGGGGVTQTGPAATQTYLFYTGSLTALDPVVPDTPIPIESSAISGVQPIVHGTYDPATRSLSDLHNRTIVYAKGANLYKVSALKGATPVATQLSNEASIPDTGVCDTYIAPDYDDHDNARYVYSLAGADGDCDGKTDNVWKMARVGMNASDVPISIGFGERPAAEVLDATTGAITGWLRVKSDRLVRLNADFAGEQFLAGAISNATFVARAPDGKIFLQLEAEFSDDLKAYDPADGTLTGALHTFDGALGIPASDGSHLYFLDGNQTIYKLALDAANPATKFRAVTGTETITAFALTTNRVVFVIHNSATDIARLSSRPKAGMSLDLLLKDVPAGKNIFLLGTAANRIYYHWGDNLLTPEIASVVTEDGALATEHTTGRWSGVTSASSGTLGAAPTLAHVTLVDIDASTLTVYDAANNTPTSISNLPSGINVVLFSGLANDGYVLGISSIAADGDIFLVNTKADNSLVRITETAGVGEHVVGGCTLNPAGAFDPLLGLILLLSVLYLTCRRGIDASARR